MSRPPSGDAPVAEIPPSVSLLGSFRQHYPEVRRVAEVFAGAGFTVRSPPLAPIRDSGREFVLFESDPPLSLDHHIQAATFEKIFSSDFVYVVNPGGYIGRTTAYELGHIHQRGMAVYYAEPPEDLPIKVPASTVLSAHDLVASILGKKISIEPIRRPRVAHYQLRISSFLRSALTSFCALLIKRGKEPYRGKSALPGGFV